MCAENHAQADRSEADSLMKELEEAVNAVQEGYYLLGKAYAAKYTPEQADPEFSSRLESIAAARSWIADRYLKLTALQLAESGQADEAEAPAAEETGAVQAIPEPQPEEAEIAPEEIAPDDAIEPAPDLEETVAVPEVPAAFGEEAASVPETPQEEPRDPAPRPIPVGGDPLLPELEQIPRTMPISPERAAEIEAMIEARLRAQEAPAEEAEPNEPFNADTPMGAGTGPLQCPHCGNLLAPDDRFCGICGWRVELSGSVGAAADADTNEEEDKTVAAPMVSDGGLFPDWGDEDTTVAVDVNGPAVNDEKTLPASTVEEGGFTPEWNDAPTALAEPQIPAEQAQAAPAEAETALPASAAEENGFTPRWNDEPAAPAHDAEEGGFVLNWNAAQPAPDVCPKCGVVLAEGSTFCYNCGIRLADYTPAPANAEALAQPEPEVQAEAPAQLEQSSAPMETAVPEPQEAAAPAPAGRVCPHCGEPVGDGMFFCENCGQKLEASDAAHGVGASVQTQISRSGGPEGRLCPHCGNRIPADSVFCEVCGARITEPAPAASPAVSAAPLQAEPAQTAAPADAGTAGGDTVNCHYCGRPIPAGSHFCENCGRRVLNIPVPEENAETDLEMTRLLLRCPACGKVIDSGMETCPGCGKQLARASRSPAEKEATPSAQPLICSNCGSENEAGSLFCTECGHTFR